MPIFAVNANTLFFSAGITERELLKISLPQDIVILHPDVTEKEVELIPWHAKVVGFVAGVSMRAAAALCGNFRAIAVGQGVSPEIFQVLHKRLNMVYLWGGVSEELRLAIPAHVQLVYQKQGLKWILYAAKDLRDEFYVAFISRKILKLILHADMPVIATDNLIAYCKAQDYWPNIEQNGQILCEAGSNPECNDNSKPTVKRHCSIGAYLN
jgi:hypothetical protein